MIGRLPRIDSSGLRIQTKWKGHHIVINTEPNMNREGGSFKHLNGLLAGYLTKINDLRLMYKPAKVAESYLVAWRGC